jgi:tetratricopeptide (TPR) repeat protein
MSMKEEKSPQWLAEEGKLFYQKKDFQGAADTFALAAQAYHALKDELMAAEMKNNQSVALLQAKQAQAALDAVLGTDLIFSQAGDLRRQGMAVANQATALDVLKRREEAIPLYENAADLLDQAGETQLRADVMRSLSALKVRKGQGLDALIAMQDGLSGVKTPTLKQRILKKLLRLRLW